MNNETIIAAADWEVLPYAEDAPGSFYMWIGDRWDFPYVSLSNMGDPHETIDFLSPVEIDELIARLHQARNWMVKKRRRADGPENG